MAASGATRRAVAKSAKSGGSLLGDIGRQARASVANRKAKQTRNGPKASETDHLQDDQFTGRHHAPSSMGSSKKNASGSMSAASTGRHSLSNGKVGRRGSYSREADVAGGYKDSVGSGYKGKHRKTGA